MVSSSCFAAYPLDETASTASTASTDLAYHLLSQLAEIAIQGYKLDGQVSDISRHASKLASTNRGVCLLKR